MLSMQSSVRGTLYLFGLVCVALAPARSQQKQSSTAVVCPATISVTESAAPIPGWTAGNATTSRRFERISVYNGEAGGREFELAPDGQTETGNKITQTWNVKNYRTMNVFMRCRYRNTSVVLSINLPSQVGSCTFRYVADRQGRVVGQSDMECR